MCQFKSKHDEIIVSLIELKSMNCAPIAKTDILNNSKNEENIICVSASIDSTLRVIGAKI